MHRVLTRSTPGRLLAAGLLAAPLLLAACGGADPGAVQDIPFTRLQADLQGDWPVATYVVRDPAQWSAAWAQHTPWQVPAPPLPAVDFSRTMLLGVSAGWGANGCMGLAITRVQADAQGLRVEYRHNDPPGPGIACTMALVPLVDFVQVPQSELPVRFQAAGA